VTPLELAQLEPILSHAIVGGPERVRSELTDLITRTSADEVIVASQIYDHAARVHSYEIVATVHENGSDPNGTVRDAVTLADRSSVFARPHS
jgi:alkanesulfonate monooxygenase SsuD/methylene tetrahydromethanopterin reductase-like flavin-dependent oxidoreductase (luciferase family)